MKKKRIIWTVLSVLWMTVIFSFSAKPADISEKESRSAGYVIGKLWIPGFEDWTEERQEAFEKQIDYPVRKAAHATEYAILGFLLCQSIASWRKEKTWMTNAGISWMAGTVYAVTDEIHQLFVPGRACMLTDVAIDSAGVCTGAAVAVLFYILYRKWKNGRQ